MLDCAGMVFVGAGIAQLELADEVLGVVAAAVSAG